MHRVHPIGSAGRVALGLMLLCIAMTGCAGSRTPKSDSNVAVTTEHLDLCSAPVRFDLYRPTAPPATPVPLVVVAHGLLRDRTHMAGWGRRLAAEGFVVAVPDMPTLGDYPRNAAAINELVRSLCDGSMGSSIRIDPHRIGMVGLSAGGLATLLAAADNPDVKVWVGLDPVDRHGLGVAAAPRVRAKAFIVRAPPSVWNNDGNARQLRDALPNCASDTVVANAVHVDPEWPSDWVMEMLIGRTKAEHRAEFAGQAVSALKSQLGGAPDSPALTRIE